MVSDANSARDEVLSGIRRALGRNAGEPVPPVPASARVAARAPGSADGELTLLLDEIGKLGGRTRRLGMDALQAALAELVRVEAIRKATLWHTPVLQTLGVAKIISDLGVEIVSAQAGKHALAQCDLGVTGVDMALPETGTLVLRASPDRPRAVSLLPRVHLALVRPSDLRADLASVWGVMRAERYFVFITGPSRTADIELTVTIGVHGPQVLVVWVLDEDSSFSQQSRPGA
jgi:L-lactate dehydrogenase complex protein LldG